MQPKQSKGTKTVATTQLQHCLTSTWLCRFVQRCLNLMQYESVWTGYGQVEVVEYVYIYILQIYYILYIYYMHINKYIYTYSTENKHNYWLKNDGLEDHVPFWNGPVSGHMLIPQGVVSFLLFWYTYHTLPYTQIQWSSSPNVMLQIYLWTTLWAIWANILINQC